MKIKSTKPKKPTKLQKLISDLPFDPASETELKGLMLVEQLLTHMKAKGINRTQLAKRMGVGPSRVTAMLNGSSNFTLETLIRAGHAVGTRLEQTLVPERLKGRWVYYRDDEIHTAFRGRQNDAILINPPFHLETDEVALNDHADAA